MNNYNKEIKILLNELKEEQNKLKEEQKLFKEEQIRFNKRVEKHNKNHKKVIVILIIFCLILSSITGVASYTLAANQVGYTAKDTSWTVDNTQDAIDELRDTVGYALVGSIFSYMGNNAPFGYLKCDGTEYNISDYPRLAEHFTSEFGSANYFGGDGSTTFKVPDLRGEFLRGTGTNSHTNQGDGANVGDHTNEGLPNITGTLGANIFWSYGGNDGTGAFSSTTTSFTKNYGGGTSGSSGTINFNATNSNVIYGNSNHVTPTNTSVLFIIKY